MCENKLATSTHFESYRQIDRHTDIHTDRETNRQDYNYTPRCFVGGQLLCTLSGAVADMHQWLIDWVRLNVPPNTLYVISGTDFYGSNDPTNSVKALKEDRSKRLGFNPIRSTPPCSQWYNNYAVWNIKTQIYTNTNKSASVKRDSEKTTVSVWYLSSDETSEKDLWNDPRRMSGRVMAVVVRVMLHQVPDSIQMTCRT